MSIFYTAQDVAALLGIATPQLRQLTNAGKVMTKMIDGKQFITADSLITLASDSKFEFLKKTLPDFIKEQRIDENSSLSSASVARLVGDNNQGVSDMIANGTLSVVVEHGEQKITGDSLITMLNDNEKYNTVLSSLDSFILYQIGTKKVERFPFPAVEALLKTTTSVLNKLIEDGLLSGSNDTVDADSLDRLVHSDDAYTDIKDKLGDFAFQQLGFEIGIDHEDELILPVSDELDAENQQEETVLTEETLPEEPEPNEIVAPPHQTEDTDTKNASTEALISSTNDASEELKSVPNHVAQYAEPEKNGGGLRRWLLPLFALVILGVVASIWLFSNGS